MNAGQKLDTGPQNAAPERLTPAQRIVGLGDRRVLVTPDCQKHKRVSPAFRDRFVRSLTVELDLWLSSPLADQPQRNGSRCNFLSQAFDAAAAENDERKIRS
jgi:hypothetical protein